MTVAIMMAEHEESKEKHPSEETVLFGNRTDGMKIRVECRRCHDVLAPVIRKVAHQLRV
jgi:hypothetical protein